MAKRKSKRLDVSSLFLDVGTLEGAHEHFRALADKQPRGEVKDALRLATAVTSTLLTAVAAAYELKGFLDDAGMWRRR
jgi:hypothetical protein